MITKNKIKASRALLEWSQEDLSKEAKISLPTIKRMETLGPAFCNHSNVVNVELALANAGITFPDEFTIKILKRLVDSQKIAAKLSRRAKEIAKS